VTENEFLESLGRIIGSEEVERCSKRFGPLTEIFYQSITNAEALVFYIYATANGWHAFINRELWSRFPNQDVVVFAYHLDKGLSKLPRYTANGGVIYRGLNVGDLKNFSKQYEVGNTVIFPAFTSASFHERGAFGGNVLFIIRSLNARVIWFLSPNFHEEEVLLPSNCRFIVEGKGMRGDRLAIVLQEIK
jgi:hypothetical protein